MIKIVLLFSTRILLGLAFFRDSSVFRKGKDRGNGFKTSGQATRDEASTAKHIRKPSPAALRPGKRPFRFYDLGGVEMSRVFLAPSRYIQGAGAIAEIGIHAARMGSKSLFIGGKTALNVCGPVVEASLKDNKVGCHKDVFDGECSDKEIGRLVSVAKANGADLIIAAGGGKVIDTGKVIGVVFHIKWTDFF